MLEKNLENCLNNAFKKAHSSNHEFVTTEHLLFCLLFLQIYLQCF